jgi:hypothetical protein
MEEMSQMDLNENNMRNMQERGPRVRVNRSAFTVQEFREQYEKVKFNVQLGSLLVFMQ